MAACFTFSGVKDEDAPVYGVIHFTLIYLIGGVS
jgi:hypothetical protein